MKTTVTGNIRFEESRKADGNIPFTEALAASYAAHRINSGYIKNGSFDYHKNIWVHHSNKDLVRNHFSQRTDTPTSIITITEEDRENAAKGMAHFKRYTLLGLGKLTDFQKDVAYLIGQETVTLGECGLISYLPTLVERERVEGETKKILKTEYSDSAHYGTVGEKFEGIVSILSARFINDYGRYVYTAGMDGNLFTFWTTLKFNLGDDYAIKGKIKRHGNAFKTGYPETLLNYVKSI